MMFSLITRVSEDGVFNILDDFAGVVDGGLSDLFFLLGGELGNSIGHWGSAILFVLFGGELGEGNWEFLFLLLERELGEANWN